RGPPLLRLAARHAPAPQRARPALPDPAGGQRARPGRLSGEAFLLTWCRTSGLRARVRGAALGLLPVLLAAEGREVQEVVGAAEHLRPARVHRVGVEHLVAVAQEEAVAG